MAEKKPAFQFYPKDFLTDEKVESMSNTEVGIYVRLMCYCWLEGSLPLETERLARFARMPLKHFTKLWENSVVKSCFHLGDDGRLHQKRLDEEREKQSDFRRRQSDNGKLGGRPVKSQINPSLSESKAKKSSPISDLQSPVSDLQTAVKATDARSKRPIFTGQRLTVFEWFLDRALKILGPEQFDAFDIHEWFFTIDGEAAKANVVIPDRDNGAWLADRLVAEARRRGLPIAQAQERPFTPAEIQVAQRVRNNQFGCRHEPRCASAQECVEEIARAIRVKAS